MKFDEDRKREQQKEAKGGDGMEGSVGLVPSGVAAWLPRPSPDASKAGANGRMANQARRK